MDIKRVMRRLRQSRKPWLLVALIAVGLTVALAYTLRQEPSREIGGQQQPAGEVPGSSPVPRAPTATAAVVPTGHPRLFFSQEDIPTLRHRAETTHKEIWRPILSYASSELGSSAPRMPNGGDLDGFRNAGNRVIATAFAYVVSGDKAYLDLTRRNLLAYSDWQYWGMRVAPERDLWASITC